MRSAPPCAGRSPPLTSICHSIRVSGCGAAGRWFARFVQNGTGAQTRAAASRLRARRCCAVERRRLPLSQAARERCLRAGLPARLLLALSPEARAFMRQARRAAAANPVHYERRRPEETTLYRLVQENLETFLAEVEARGMANLPQFVKDEFDAFLECGILAHGFLRVRLARSAATRSRWPFRASGAAFAPRAGRGAWRELPPG